MQWERAGAQVLTTRARKDVKLEDVKVQVLLFAFDCLFMNGEVLVEKTLTERRKALEAAIAPRQGVLQIATSKVMLQNEPTYQYEHRPTSA